MSNDAEWIAQIAREEAEKVLVEHTIPAFPAYFFRKDWLVTYDWFAYERDRLSQRIAHLEQRLAQLERPWWKRWRSR